MPRRPLAAVLGLVLTAPLLVLAPPATAAPVAIPAKPYDFDGDGFPELAIGVAGLTVGQAQPGGVVVLPASPDGLALNEQIITTDTAGVGDGVDGSVLTSADFNRDGYADLAVGNPVTILFGSGDGLTGADSYDLGPQSAGAEALQVGYFDPDPWPDLAVGLSDADGQPGVPAPGAVRIYRGGAQGFALARSSVLMGVRQQPAVDLNFGSSLAVGRLNGDDVDDLVVGAPGPEGYDDDDEGFQNPGSVSVCYGGTNGLAGCTRVVRGFRYAGSTSVAVGNISGDARPEIVLGIPYPELISDPSDVYEERRIGGAVEVMTLSGSGSTTTATSLQLTQDSKGVPGSDEYFDGFGQSIAVGDLDQKGYADLVVGAPNEDHGKTKDAGRVTVIYGAAKGYQTTGNKIFDQGTKGVPGKPEKTDGFGFALSLLDHDADGRLDLAVGAPGEDATKTISLGAVTTLAGSGKAFTTKGSRTFTLKTLGYPQASATEFFGNVLGQ